MAYQSVCNFGAFLQLLSTIEYIKSKGHNPRVLNWVPKDLEQTYKRVSPPNVWEMFANMRSLYFPLTKVCRTEREIADVIVEENIKAVIIGSDAVCQHHPFFERLHFPTRTIYHLDHLTSDRMFPNPFWGLFNDYLNEKVPVAVISASSQDSQYRYINGQMKKRMKYAILSYKFLSVRDDWTQKMMSYLTDNEIRPQITPDPVFSFNQNAGALIPNKETILSKYKLPEKYVLISFKNNKYVSQEWISTFEYMAKKKGLCCVKLPYADGGTFGDMDYDVGSCLSPIDWYALIKYSSGYVGNNMHPIVVCLHNVIPFFSFDNYGSTKWRGLVVNEKSSKIYHILSAADLLEYRVFTKAKNYIVPDPVDVFEKLISFNYDKEKTFSRMYYSRYTEMMNNVMTIIK